MEGDTTPLPKNEDMVSNCFSQKGDVKTEIGESNEDNARAQKVKITQVLFWEDRGTEGLLCRYQTIA